MFQRHMTSTRPYNVIFADFLSHLSNSRGKTILWLVWTHRKEKEYILRGWSQQPIDIKITGHLIDNWIERKLISNHAALQ